MNSTAELILGDVKQTQAVQLTSRIQSHIIKHVHEIKRVNVGACVCMRYGFFDGSFITIYNPNDGYLDCRYHKEIIEDLHRYFNPSLS